MSTTNPNTGYSTMGGEGQPQPQQQTQPQSHFVNAAPSVPIYGANPQYVIQQQPLYAIQPQQMVGMGGGHVVLVSSVKPFSLYNWTLLAIYTIMTIIMICCYALPLYYINYSTDSSSTSKGYWNRLDTPNNPLLTGSYSSISSTFREFGSLSRVSWWADDCDTESKAFGGLLGVALASLIGCIICLLRRMCFMRSLPVTIRAMAFERFLLAIGKIFLLISFWLFYRGCINDVSYINGASASAGLWVGQIVAFVIGWVATIILWKIRSAVAVQQL